MTSLSWVHPASASSGVVLQESFDQVASSGIVAERYANSMWTGAQFGNAGGKYSDRNISVRNGSLVLSLRHGVGAYVAFDPTHQGYTYGRYRFSVKVTGRQLGYGVAFLLWPSSNVPREGEMDLLEGNLTSTMKIFHHTMTCEPRVPVEYCGNQNIVDTGKKFANSGWHHVDVTWTKTSVTYKVDGKTRLKATKSVPHTPHFLVVQVAKEGKAFSGRAEIRIGSVRIDR